MKHAPGIGLVSFVLFTGVGCDGAKQSAEEEEPQEKPARVETATTTGGESGVDEARAEAGEVPKSEMEAVRERMGLSTNGEPTGEAEGALFGGAAGRAPKGGVEEARQRLGPGVRLPYATPVPGRPGFVFCPYTNEAVDVRGIRSGTLVTSNPTAKDGSQFFYVP